MATLRHVQVRLPLTMTKLLPGRCAACGGHLEFPADAVGTTADCPHCGRPTELLLATPPPERSVPTKTIVYTVITILILIGGLIAALIVLNKAQRAAAEKTPAPATSPR